MGPILAMTNYGALAILALDRKRRGKVLSPGEADLRWLIALETFTADAKGWRTAGSKKLAESAGMAYGTSRHVRERLVSDGLVEYRPGNGKGKKSAYRLLFDLTADADAEATEIEPSPAKTPPKVSSQAEHLSGKVSSQAEHLSDPQRCSPERPKVLTWPSKGAQQNPLASGNENAALDTSALDTSALLSPRARVRDSAPAGDTDDERENDDLDEDEDEEEPNPDFDLLAGAVPGADPRDIEWALASLEFRKAHGEIRSVRAYLRRIIANGDARSLVDDGAYDRRRTEIEAARAGDPFGTDPFASLPNVAHGEVIRDDDAWPARTPSVPRIAGPAAHAAMPSDLKADLAGKRLPGWRPQWCGQCDERTRMRELADGRMARCEACNPNAAAVPARPVVAGEVIRREDDPGILPAGRGDDPEPSAQEPGGVAEPAPVPATARPAAAPVPATARPAAAPNPNARREGESAGDYQRRMMDALMALDREHRGEAVSR